MVVMMLIILVTMIAIWSLLLARFLPWLLLHFALCTVAARLVGRDSAVMMMLYGNDDGDVDDIGNDDSDVVFSSGTVSTSVISSTLPMLPCLP